MNEQLQLPIIQENIAGQNSSIRSGDINDPEDLKAVRKILESEGYRNNIGFDDTPVTDEDVKYYFNDNPKNALIRLLGDAKSGRSTWFVSKSVKHKSPETGSIQGFIMLAKYGYSNRYLEQCDARRKELNLITSSDVEYPVIEIFSAKNPNADTGQMASATRQVAFEVYKAAIEDSIKYGKELEIGDNPKVMLLSHIGKTNTDSIRAAEAAGFIHIGDLEGWLVYQMDWNKLKQLINEKVSTEKVTSIAVNMNKTS